MARLLMQALRQAGYDVTLACRFRSWEGYGDTARQQRLRALAQRFVTRLLRRYRRGNMPLPDVWFTYHLYHKAPDWLGPVISRSLSIPYLVAEASYATKQADGPWAEGHKASADALQQASAVVALNRSDMPGVEPLLAPDARVVHLKPFHECAAATLRPTRSLARRTLIQEFDIDPRMRWLITVGMMRAGAKLASYDLLAQALRKVANLNWQLIVVGDGVCRARVEDLFRSVQEKVFFAGRRNARELTSFYAAADIFLWPAIKEAYGMAILEAQSAGLPVVAGNSGGVGDIVRDEVTGCLVPEGEIAAFAQATGRLLSDTERCREMGAAARQLMAREHDIASASRVLAQIVEQVSDA